MSPITKFVVVQAALPIERLAEKLPASRLDELRAVHNAGDQNNHALQMKLLDDMRKTISSDAVNPKTSAMLKENLRGCIEAIDLMRAQTSLKVAGSSNVQELKLASDKALMPPELAKPMAELRDISTQVGPVMAKEAALYMSRVEACAKMGAFGMVDRYSTELLGKLHKAQMESPQAILGRLSAKVRDVTSSAGALEQKVKMGVDVHAQADTTVNTVVEGPAETTPTVSPQAPKRVPGSGAYLMSTLRSAPEQNKNKTLGLMN